MERPLLVDEPAPHLLRAEVAPHAEFAVFQALASPCLEIKDTTVEALGDETWQIERRNRQHGLAADPRDRPGGEERPGPPDRRRTRGVESGRSVERVEFLGAPARRRSASSAAVSTPGSVTVSDGTPDRALVTWVVRAAPAPK